MRRYRHPRARGATMQDRKYFKQRRDRLAGSPEVAAVLANLPGITAAETAAVTTFVERSIADGNWSLIDECWMLGLSSSALNGFKIGLTGTLDTGSSLSSPDGAITTGVSDGGVDLNYSPLNSTSPAEQNNHQIGFYASNIGSTTPFQFGMGAGQAFSGSRTGFMWRGDEIAVSVNEDNNPIQMGSSHPVVANELYAGARFAASGNPSGRMYVNGVQLAQGALSTSLTPPSANLHIGAIATAAGTPGTWAFAYTGKQIGFDHAAFNGAVQAFMTELAVTGSDWTLPIITGDSHTDNDVRTWTQFMPAWFDLSYDESLSSEWLGPNYNITPVGNGMEVNLPGWLSTYSDADYVIIQGGTNDIGQYGPTNTPYITPLSTAETNLRTTLGDMISDVQAAGMKPFVILPPPISGYTPDDGAKGEWLYDYIVWARITLDAAEIPYIDSYALFEDPNDPGQIIPVYDFDGVHINPAGAAVWAAAIAAKLVQLRKQS